MYSTIALIFWALVFGLIAIILYCLLALKQKFTPRKAIKRPKLIRKHKRSHFEARIEESKQRILQSVSIMENAPPIEEVRAQQQKKTASSLFDKLKASRTKRKQAPISGATSAIKSLKGRKV